MCWRKAHRPWLENFSCFPGLTVSHFAVHLTGRFSVLLPSAHQRLPPLWEVFLFVQSSRSSSEHTSTSSSFRAAHCPATPNQTILLGDRTLRLSSALIFLEGPQAGRDRDHCLLPEAFSLLTLNALAAGMNHEK